GASVNQDLLVMSYYVARAFLSYFVSFGFYSNLLRLDAAGILGIQLPAALERSPVRGDALYSLGSGFIRCVCGQPRENAGSERTTEGGTMFSRDAGPHEVNCYHAPHRHRPHQGVHLQRRGNR